MVAYTRAPGNAVFAMMVFDFIGYVAAILFMIVADMFKDSNHLEVLVHFTWVLTVGGAGAILVAMLLIARLRVFAPPAEATVTRDSAQT